MLAPGVAGTGPSFSAYLGSAQSISNATYTKVQCGTEEYDTANCYDPATYRFTPNVAGYYLFTGAVAFQNSVTAAQCLFYKNGSAARVGNNASGYWTAGSAVIFCNGSTDYVEFYVATLNGNTQSTNSGAPYVYFQGSLVRAA